MIIFFVLKNVDSRKNKFVNYKGDILDNVIDVIIFFDISKRDIRPVC